MSDTFDTVSHNILIEQLRVFAGITDSALQHVQWVVSYLTDRRQAVKIQ